MKANKRKVGWLFSAVGVISFYFYLSSYSEFEPVVFDLNVDKYRVIPVSPGFYKNLKTVLGVYDVPYKESNSGKILILRKDKLFTELMWNFTTKALDTAWLRMHTTIE